ncbi:hypothetical protein [Sphingomonas sp. R86521]|uniref:hypothetical protein n=1 Tax=Sphingomonas sp. R86521 TaxID=3093860 RepID=UPI0036D3421C
MLTETTSRLQQQGEDFQQTLPHTIRPYASRAWGHGLHSLCSYQGKLKPSLAHWMVRQFTAPGDRVVDPLGGVGTIAFEAGLLGRVPFTTDLSPFASTVARAKVAPPTPELLWAAFEQFTSALELEKLSDDDTASAAFGLNATVSDYYHPETLQEVLKAKRYFSARDLSAGSNFIKACLLHILHGNRPYALSRTSHPITPFSPTGEFEYRSVVERLQKRLLRLIELDRPNEFNPGQSWHSDFRGLPELLDAPVDAVLCSPPFPGMRFDRPNWLRMWFCGWGANDFHQTSKSFLERQQGKTFSVYKEFFATCAEITKSGSPVILHVGGSKGYDMATHLIELSRPYFRHQGTVIEAVDHVEKHGISDKGTTSSHILLLFERF